MLTDRDVEWLHEQQPKLSVSDDRSEVSGIIDLIATYDGKRFLCLDGGVKNTLGGEILSGRFRIKIKEREKKTTSDLPTLIIDEPKIVPNLDRHLNTPDGTACVCGPIEEKILFASSFDFQLFFTQLVVPFLYAQLYYDRHGKWPWGEIAHGSVGILEDYLYQGDSMYAAQCLKLLRHDPGAWARIQPALLQKREIKGHALCFCGSGKRVRRCHVDAWKGIRALRRDLKKQGVDEITE